MLWACQALPAKCRCSRSIPADEGWCAAFHAAAALPSSLKQCFWSNLALMTLSFLPTNAPVPLSASRRGGSELFIWHGKEILTRMLKMENAHVCRRVSGNKTHRPTFRLCRVKTEPSFSPEESISVHTTFKVKKRRLRGKKQSRLSQKQSFLTFSVHQPILSSSYQCHHGIYRTFLKPTQTNMEFLWHFFDD